MLKNQLSYFIIIVTIFYSCANQKPPTGGEKDEEPPKLVNSNPKDQQVDFKGKEIILTFNEAIKLNNPKEQLIITPRVDNEYEVKFKKDNVIIEFEQYLRDSTTFTFNFREAIQDLNEGNPAENLKIAFSTGSYLDSLRISGTVKHLLSGKPADDLIVGLYDLYDTIDFLADKPYYFTKTNKEGAYLFENLQWGVYQIATFQDKNKNLVIDPATEVYGFLPDTLYLEKNLDSVYLVTQTLDVRPISLVSARQSGTTYDLKYNKFIRDYSLKNEDSVELISNYIDEKQQSISIYNTGNISDSVLTYVNVTDTLYQTYQDTIYVKFEPTTRKPANLEMKVRLDPIVAGNGTLTGQIDFNKPIIKTNYDSVYIYLDSTNLLFLDSTHIVFSENYDQAKLSYLIDQKFFNKPEPKDTTKVPATEKKLPPKSDVTAETITTTKKEEKPYFFISDNAFISVEQDTSQSAKAPLNFTQVSNLGTWQVEVQPNDYQSFIVQLLDKNFNVIQQRYNEKNIKFEFLQPGEYRIRVLIDSNNNGYWEPGNILKSQLPEPVTFFINSEGQQLTTLRANWEVGPSIIEL